MIRIYTKPDCPQCKMTEQLLLKNHIKYNKVDITKHPESRDKLISMGYKSAPVVVANGMRWSGFRPDKLRQLVRAKSR